MITWMQRHKKYLIITIWISTIAFVGAGFVGWGQYSYGDKAGSVAKVGDVEVSMGELQKSYSNLYNQYNQVFQGNFDEEKAKSFGLQSQALKQLIEQALILNLAASYDLEVSDAELLSEIKNQEYFFKDGSFDKEIYKQALSRNRLSIKEYEADVRKQLLIQKVFQLLEVNVSESETDALDAVLNIADKIDYKVLSDKQISVDTSDKNLKPYWEAMQQDFMNEVSYELNYIKQESISKAFDDAQINEHYLKNKTHFKDADGKILPLAEAKKDVIAELNADATKDFALRTYISFKKGTLDENIKVLSSTISASKNPFDDETLEMISKLSLTSPFMKPVLVDGTYYTFELKKINPAMPKSYEEAKSEVLELYVAEQKKSKLIELAQNSYETFNGTKTDFITSSDTKKITKLDETDAENFLKQLFVQESKKGYISLDNGKIVLYNVLEQKLLKKTKTMQEKSILEIKSSMFAQGLMKNLENKYKTEMFIQGL